MKVLEPAIEALFPRGRGIESGVTVVHRRAVGTMPGYGSRHWPACHPPHHHPCANAGLEEPNQTPVNPCANKCVCLCDCGEETWTSLGLVHASNLGAVPCDDMACFGGYR